MVLLIGRFLRLFSIAVVNLSDVIMVSISDNHCGEKEALLCVRVSNADLNAGFDDTDDASVPVLIIIAPGVRECGLMGLSKYSASGTHRRR